LKEPVKQAILIGAIVAAIVGIIIGLVAYSYTQIQINLENVSYGGLDWAPLSFSTLIKAGLKGGLELLQGNNFAAILSVVSTFITGLKLNLMFALSNHGIFPVYIPEISYDLSVNGIKIGQGHSIIDETINPGDTKNLPLFQDFQFGSFEPVATSVIASGGIVDLQVSGTSYFKFLGLTVPVPFQHSTRISLKDEIVNHIKNTLR
jgi:LEA14-like dessication related protein